MADSPNQFKPNELYILKCTGASGNKTYSVVTPTDDYLKVKRAFPMKPTLAELVEK